MSLFDIVAPAVDSVESQASITSGMGIGERAAAGATAAAISGLGSIYNTFASGANLLGADATMMDTANQLADMDTRWSALYKENKETLDTAGFIAGSFIPGSIGVKALNLARAGEGAGAVGRALGFAQTKQSQYLSRALTELGTEGGSVFTNINKNKLASMAWGAADQTLQAAAFETAVAATMYKSPVFENDSWWDIGKTALTGALFGGVIGGSIDALILNRSFKKAVGALDKKATDYQAITDLSGFNLTAGDKAFAITDSLVNLPKEVLESDKLLDLSFHVARPDKVAGWNPLTKTIRTDISKVLDRTLTGSQTVGLQNLEKQLRELSEHSDVAGPMALKVLEDFSALRAAGTEPAQIRERLGDYLFGLKSVDAVTTTPKFGQEDLWYFKKSLTADELSKIKTTKDWENAAKSTTPFGENAYSKPYIFVGTAEQRQQAFANVARIGSGTDESFDTLAAAWKAGNDTAVLSDGTFRVNPKSNLWKRVEDPVTSSKQFLNTRTGAFTDSTVLTAADQVPAGSTLTLTAQGVIIPSVQGAKNRVINMAEGFKESADTTYYTARHAWAGVLEEKNIPDLIHVNDFSLMDRLRTASPETLERVTILRPDGSELYSAAEISIPEMVRNAKLSEAQRIFAEAFEEGTTRDVREVAYRLNVDGKWLEESVANRFSQSYEGAVTGRVSTPDMDKGLSMPLGSYARRENVQVNYDLPGQFTELATIKPTDTWQAKRNAILDQVANNGGQFVTGELAWSYRVQQAVQVNKEAATAVLGSERASKLIELQQTAAKLADSNGAGSSTFGSANANYGDQLELAAQTSGKMVHLWAQEDTAKMMEIMGPLSLKIQRDPKAAAELGVVTNLLRNSDEKYVWNPATPNQLMLRELKDLQGEKLQSALQQATAEGRKLYIDVQNPTVVEFLVGHTGINADRVGKRQVLWNAKGTTTNYQPDTVYVPPIDTTYFQHFAFVRPIEGRAFGTSEVTMVFGRDAAELQKRMAMIDNKNFTVVSKRGTEEWFKAKDLYDYNLTINEPRINSELRKSGALANIFPEVRAGNIVEDYLRWHQNQTKRLVRDSVETNYAQQFAELRSLGKSYTDVATSKFAGSARASSTEVTNPFDDYIKTFLDVSKRSEYTFLHQANEFVDALGVRAYRFVDDAFGKANKGLIDYKEVNDIMNKYGVKGIYENQDQLIIANAPRDRNLIRETLSKANAFLANTVLRLDFFNSVLNTVSTPLLLSTELASIKTLAAKDPELLGKLNEALTIAMPGSTTRVPSSTKLMANAIQNYFGSEGKTLVARYKANGDIRETLQQVHSMMDDIAMRPDYKVFSDGVTKAFEKGAKITLNEQAEQFTRFISADVMRQLTEPAVAKGALSLAEQNAFISVFTNRVQGNYITSQRPIVFQGVLGSAVSLFQTYSFNLMQQLFRHVENKDKRAVATLFGMQAGLFGLNGTPFFEAVNTHLIGNAATNQGHTDAYSFTPNLLGKEVGDWLMYGTASALPLVMNGQTPALYSRGDINPRHMTILPLNPLDIPAIDASRRIVSNLVDVGSKIAGGAAIGQSLLQGLEHNGVNRPLSGLAQVVNQQATTSKGSLISASSDFSMIASSSRILGSRPMDEAVALNNMYRLKSYEAADTARREALGERAKSYLNKNQFPPDDVIDDLMKDYARAGGRIENFQASMQKWTRDANVSVVEKMRAKMQSPYGQRLSEIMGGEPLPDWNNTVIEPAPEVSGEVQ